MAGFKNYILVDPNVGYGDYNSIPAAQTAAVAAGMSVTNPFTFELAAGSFTGDVELFGGTRIIGKGSRTSIIIGKCDMHSGVAGMNFSIQPGSGNTYALKVIADTANRGVTLENINITLATDVTSRVSAIRCTGTALGGIVAIRNSYLYPKNSSTNPAAAELCVFEIQSDFSSIIECFATHFKTSSGGGYARSVLAIVDVVSPLMDPGGYVHLTGDWVDVHGGDGNTPVPLLLKSVNTIHPGGVVDVSYFNEFTTEMPGIEVANETYSTFYSSTRNNLRVMGQLSKHHEDEDFRIVPVIALDHAPTGADTAPEGSHVVVLA